MKHTRFFIIYGLVLVGAIAAFFAIRSVGLTLVAPLQSLDFFAITKTSAGSHVVSDILFALGAVILLGRLLARVCARIGQPPVIGEILAGILLGPSLLGENISAWILPRTSLPFLDVIAQLGIILYMFSVGVELDLNRLKNRAHAIIATSHASIVVPFLLGSILALFLYPRLGLNTTSFTSFALFMGVAMSITAFPVLARILTDRKLVQTELGIIALSCAAIDDVTAWCLLAVVVGVVNVEVSQSLFVIAGATTFIGVMIFVIRPILARTSSLLSLKVLPQSAVNLIFVALLASAFIAERIGIHAIFGAFLLGVIIPHDHPVTKKLSRQIESVVKILLLPAFFAVTGMRTRIDLLSTPEHWFLCLLIITVATVGKFGGTYIAARTSGFGSKTSAALGALMNTRGLMELIVLNIGLELGVISPPLFAMMVIMAIVTTMSTAPVLRLLRV